MIPHVHMSNCQYCKIFQNDFSNDDDAHLGNAYAT